MQQFLAERGIGQGEDTSHAVAIQETRQIGIAFEDLRQEQIDIVKIYLDGRGVPAAASRPPEPSQVKTCQDVTSFCQCFAGVLIPADVFTSQVLFDSVSRAGR